MSMLVHIIRVQATRRAQRKQERSEWERVALTPRAIKARRLRRILAGLLMTIAAIAFVEVVLVPGSMIRHNLASDTTSSDDESQHELRLPFGLLTDEQRATQRQQQLQRIEQQLRSTHQKLGNACLALSKAQESMQEYAESKLQLALPQAGAEVPPLLVDVMAHEPTARFAWTRLAELSEQGNTQLQDAHELLDAVASRFNAGSFLPEDDHDMRAMARQVEQTRSAMLKARVFIDHVATLQRARASLARQASLDEPSGDSK